MAEFGPKVFHALGMYADKKRNNGFETALPSDVGLSESKPNGEPITDAELAEQIEKVKNAFFKVIMFRVRNTMMSLGENKTKTILTENGGLPITLTLTFSDRAIHAWKEADDEETAKLKLSLLEVRGIRAQPELWDLPDMHDIYRSFNTLAMACGSGPQFDEKLSKKLEDGEVINDCVFQSLWG